MREFVPQAERIFRDQYVMEFIGGKEYEQINVVAKATFSRAILLQCRFFFLSLSVLELNNPLLCQ